MPLSGTATPVEAFRPHLPRQVRTRISRLGWIGAFRLGWIGAFAWVGLVLRDRAGLALSALVGLVLPDRAGLALSARTGLALPDGGRRADACRLGWVRASRSGVGRHFPIRRGSGFHFGWAGACRSTQARTSAPAGVGSSRFQPGQRFLLRLGSCLTSCLPSPRAGARHPDLAAWDSPLAGAGIQPRLEGASRPTLGWASRSSRGGCFRAGRGLVRLPSVRPLPCPAGRAGEACGTAGSGPRRSSGMVRRV